jgi:flagellar basal-body rod modification protein FlgD
MDISSLTGATAEAGKAAASEKNLTEDFNTFLVLLTTQLQNQDPLDPMDSSEFTNQLVQFSSVEQAIATNKNLEQLISLSNADRLNNAVGYLGHDVTVRSGTTSLKDGSAAWQYQQDQQDQLMESVSLLITDSTGKIVYVADGDLNPGTHEFVWDGKDNAGVLLPEGQYSLTASATDITGEAITPPVFVSGRVTGVETIDGEPVLTVNGTKVPLAGVTSILEAETEAETS